MQNALHVAPANADGLSDEIDVVLQAAEAEVAGYKKLMKTSATNLICMVAYVFRIRGHHYMDGPPVGQTQA